MSSNSSPGGDWRSVKRQGFPREGLMKGVSAWPKSSVRVRRARSTISRGKGTMRKAVVVVIPPLYTESRDGASGGFRCNFCPDLSLQFVQPGLDRGDIGQGAFRQRRRVGPRVHRPVLLD